MSGFRANVGEFAVSEILGPAPVTLFYWRNQRAPRSHTARFYDIRRMHTIEDQYIVRCERAKLEVFFGDGGRYISAYDASTLRQALAGAQSRLSREYMLALDLCMKDYAERPPVPLAPPTTRPWNAVEP